MGFTHKGLLPTDDAAKIKCCLHCNTTTTPLWRGGPAGPKSLCNACGIRFRKRRISALGCDRKRDRLHNDASTVSASSSCSGTTAGGRDREEDLGECASLRMRLMMAFGEEGVVVVQNLPSSVKKQRCQRRRKLGEEEEQAAVSLMALSCGSVFG